MQEPSKRQPVTYLSTDRCSLVRVAAGRGGRTGYCIRRVAKNGYVANQAWSLSP